MADGDPISWLMIEPGWKVHASDGAEIARVEEVVGDKTNDIFSGLAVSSGVLTGLLSKSKFVPAERVVEITEGRVDLDLPADTLETLDEHEPAPAPEQLRP